MLPHSKSIERFKDGRRVKSQKVPGMTFYFQQSAHLMDTLLSHEATEEDL